MGVVAPIAALGVVVPVLSGRHRRRAAGARSSWSGSCWRSSASCWRADPSSAASAGARRCCSRPFAAVGFGLALTLPGQGRGVERAADADAHARVEPGVVAGDRARRAVGRRGAPARPAGSSPASASATSTANLCFALASHRGLLSLVAVAGSLYPVATIAAGPRRPPRAAGRDPVRGRRGGARRRRADRGRRSLIGAGGSDRPHRDPPTPPPTRRSCAPAGASPCRTRRSGSCARPAGRCRSTASCARASPMLEACFRPDLVVEITLQPVRRHGVDAAIFFSDIVVPLKAIGVDLDIEPGRRPGRRRADPRRAPTSTGCARWTPDDVAYVAEAVAAAGRRARRDAADRLRGRAVHARVLPRRGRPVARPRAAPRR